MLSSPKNQDTTPTQYRARRDFYFMLALFIIIWLLCFGTVFISRQFQYHLPAWVKEAQYKSQDTQLREFSSQSEIFSDDNFAYMLRDGMTGRPIPLAEVKSKTFGDTEPSNGGATADEGNKNIETDEAVPVITWHTLDICIMDATFISETNKNSLDKFMFYVKRDECIVHKGDTLYSTENYKNIRSFTPGYYRLMAYKKFTESAIVQSCSFEWMLYNAITTAIIILSIGIFIWMMRHEFFESNTGLLVSIICTVLHLGFILLCQFIYRSLNCAPYFFILVLLPTSLGPALISNMMSKRIGFSIALLLSAMTPLFVGGDQQFQIFILALACSAVSVACYSDIHTREQFLTGGLKIFAVLMFFSFFFMVQHGQHWLSELLRPYWYMLPILGCINVIIIMLMMLMVPVLVEKCSDITTAFTFYELTNKANSLLRRLQEEASGTFQHSMVVARLATEAAKAIGANEKLTETCAYFHDVGKLWDPLKFGENQQGRDNPHDALTPLESCAIIREHVKYGLELAQKARLPKQVMEAIAQHHGTSIMQAFYRKACSEAAKNGEPKPAPDEYKYQGGLPRRKEVVLVAIADFCEAAVRSCINHTESPNCQMIRAKVDELVMEKLAEHQFDQAQITMSELRQVIDRMAETLRIIHHIRPEYPNAN